MPGYYPTSDIDDEDDLLEKYIAASLQQRPEPLPPRAAQAQAAYQQLPPDRPTGTEIRPPRPEAPEEMGELGVAPVPQLPPAAPPPRSPSPLPPDDELEAFIAQSLKQRPEQPEPPVPQPADMTGTMVADPTGQRPNPYGMEDEFGGPSREQIFAQLAEARKRTPQHAPQQSQQDAIAALADNGHDPDVDWALSSVLGGPELAMKRFQAGQQRQSQEMSRQQQLMQMQAQAAERDRLNAPASLAEQQLVAGSGLVSPEAAAQMQRGDKALHAASAGGYALPTRQRGQDMQQGRAYVKEIGQNYRQGRELESRAELAGDRNQTQRDVAGIYAQGREARRPQAMRASPALVSERAAVPMDRVEAYMSGNEHAVSPDEKMRIDRFVSIFSEARPELQERIASNVVNTATRDIHTPIQQSNNPALVLREQGKHDDLAVPFRAAYSAAQRLGPKLKVLATYGSDGWAGDLRNAQLSDEDQAAAQELGTLMQTYAHGNFGAALTPQEAQKLGELTGIQYGSKVAFWNSPARITSFLNGMKRVLAEREKLLGEQLRQGY